MLIIWNALLDVEILHDEYGKVLSVIEVCVHAIGSKRNVIWLSTKI